MLHKQLAGLICSALLLLPIGFNGEDALLPSPTPKVTAAALWEETGLSFNPETAIEPEDRFFYEEEVVFPQEGIVYGVIEARNWLCYTPTQDNEQCFPKTDVLIPR